MRSQCCKCIHIGRLFTCRACGHRICVACRPTLATQPRRKVRP